MDRRQVAEEVLAAVGGKDNVVANDVCMTRLRLLTKDPALVNTEQLSSASGVLGYVRRGANGLEVVFGPGKVEAIHEAIASITGIDSTGAAFSAADSQPASLHVHITPNPLDDAARPKGAPQSAPRGASPDPQNGTRGEKPAADPDGAQNVAELVSLLDDMPKGGTDKAAGSADAEDLLGPEDADGPKAGRVLVINGPSINMLGVREPDIYGNDTYQTLLRTCKEAAVEAGFDGCTCFQSNHEGDLIDAIQDAYGCYAGIVINPGAYTHTSIALLDAAKAVALPVVEVHISKVGEREDFRKVSYIRAACFETISGEGIQGYRRAIFDLAEHIGL